MGSGFLNPIFYRNCIIFAAVSSTVQMQICCEFAFYIVEKLVHRIGSSLFTLVWLRKLVPTKQKKNRQLPKSCAMLYCYFNIYTHI